MLMYGSGSRTSHNTMALHLDDELHIVESDEAGIIKTKWEDWIGLKSELGQDIIHMPLRKDLSEKFDAEKARQFFDETAGLPYGFHTFIYGWLDTPRDNLPPLLPNEFLPIMFSMIEAIDPELSDMVFTSGLNMRLGTEGLSISQVAQKAAEQGMTLQELMAVPEQDGSVYSGIEPRDGQSFVCSAYVTALLKAAGIFDGLEINATEFTPTDVSELKIYESEAQLPDMCTKADASLPYC